MKQVIRLHKFLPSAGRGERVTSCRVQVVGCRLHVAGEICFNFEFVFEFGSDFEFYLSFVIWFLVLSKLIADLTAVVAFPFEFRVSGFRLPQFLLVLAI